MDYLIDDLEEARGKLISASSLLEGAGFQSQIEDIGDLLEDIEDKLKNMKEARALRWEAENRQANIEYRMGIGI